MPPPLVCLRALLEASTACLAGAENMPSTVVLVAMCELNAIAAGLNQAVGNNEHMPARGSTPEQEAVALYHSVAGKCYQHCGCGI